MEKLILIVCILFASTSGFSATKTWIGDSDSDWNNADNWDDNELPDDNDDIIIDANSYSGNNAPIISSDSDFDPDNITVRNNGVLTMTGGDLELDEDINIESGGIFDVTGGDLDVGDDISVDNGTFSFSGSTLDVGEIEGSNGSTVNLTGGVVTMTGNLDANSNSVFTISTTVTQEDDDDEDLDIGTGASFIIEDGALITGFGDVDFDGSGGASYIQTGGIVSLEDDFKLEDGDNNTVVISGGVLNVDDDFGIYTDNNSITFSGDADINIDDDFNFENGEDNVINVTEDAIVDVEEEVQFEGETSNFFNIDGNSHVTIHDGSSDPDDEQEAADDYFNVTENGYLKLGDLDAILPVQLIEFKGNVEEKTVALNWSTASEKDNDYFEILKSEDGITFTPMGKVAGHGTSNSVNYYDYIDQNPKPGINYYKLRQVDYDGKNESFPVIYIIYGKSEMDDTHIVVWPNPVVDNKFKITVDYGEWTGTATASLMDLQGRILTIALFLQHTNSIDIDVSNLGLKSGIYILEFNDYVSKIRKQIILK